MSLSDARRMYVLLRDAGPTGVHSHDLRSSGTTGQPSQRAKDIVSEGVALSTKRENRGKRPGSRYWLAGQAPSDATPVLPNRAARTCQECGASIEHLRDKARFCDSTCRARHSEHTKASEGHTNAHKRSNNEALTVSASPPDTHERVAIVRDGDSFSEVPVRACRRCKSTGQLASGECPACFGTGVIARARVNSYVEAEAA